MLERDASAVRQIWLGCVLLAVCAGFYLVWWCVAFRPQKTPRPVLDVVLFAAAAISGLVAVIQMVQGISGMETSRELLPSKWILPGGILVYILMLAITSAVLHRQVTTELFLIVGWGVLTLSALNALYGAEIFSLRLSAAFLIIGAVGVAVSIYCYLIYYALAEWRAYADGMVPLIMTAVVMGAIAAAISFSMKNASGI